MNKRTDIASSNVIRSIFVKTYVNCVKFLSENYLLASAGTVLQLYELRQCKVIDEVQIFSPQRIHGIIVKDNTLYHTRSCQVLAYGGLNISLLEVSFTSNIPFKTTIQWTAKSWVQDVAFFENSRFAVLGSCNVLYLYQLISDPVRNIIVEKCVHCTEKSVLYSAKILGSNWEDAVILCGTVFSQVTIWSPVIDEANVIHRLVAHQGVIFSVTFHEQNQTICSTSDDRTLRVWYVKWQTELKPMCQKWKTAQISLKYTIYGHTARVWKNLQLNDGKIISIGEDGQLKVWLNGQCSHHWDTHQNSNVWSLDYSETLNLIVTGGGDAGISLWPLFKKEDFWEPKKLNLKELSPTNQSHPVEDFPRQVLVGRKKRCFLVTNNGTFLSYDKESRVMLQDARFSSYCVLSLSNNKKWIGAASIGGDVFILNEESEQVMCEFNVGNRKIFSFHWLDNDMFVICTLEGCLTIYKFDSDQLISRSEASNVTQKYQLVLPEAKERWLTSALLLEELFVCGDRDGSIHVFNLERSAILKTYFKVHSRLGVSCIENKQGHHVLSIGRDGFLRHWKVMEESGSEGDDTMEVRNSADRSDTESKNLYHISSDKLPIEWPSSVVSTPSDTYILGFSEVHCVIWSVTRQQILFRVKCGGGHRSWHFSLDDQSLYFCFIKQKHVYVVDLDLSKIIRPTLVKPFHRDEINALTVLNEQLIVSGGEDNTIRIFCLNHLQTKQNAPIDLHTRLILRSHISSIRCVASREVNKTVYMVSGGGRAQLKIWKLMENTINTEDVNVQCKELYSHMLNGEDRKEKSWKCVTPRIISETRYMDVALFSYERCANDSHLYIVTACSDGFIRVFVYNMDQHTFHIVRELGFHNKCVLKVNVKSYEHSLFMFSMATDGVIAIWDLEKLVCTDSEQLVHTDSEGLVCTDGEKLVYSDRNTKLISSSKCTNVRKCFHDDKEENGDTSESYQTCKKNEHLSSKIILNSTARNHSSISNKQSKSLLYSRSESPLVHLKVHQSGINSFACEIISNDLYLVTGGDDCALVLTIFDSKLQLLKQLRKDRAHGSQLTGVVFLDQAHIVTCSVDEKVIVWKWSDDELLVCCEYKSCIPDSHGITKIAEDVVCVYGCGIDVLRIRTS